MKSAQKNSFGDGKQWISHGKPSSPSSSSLTLKVLIFFIVSISFIYSLYILSLFISPSSCDTTTNAISNEIKTENFIANSSSSSLQSPPPPAPLSASNLNLNATNISHIVFGIAASSNLWQKRKEYIKIWYNPKKMRGFVWLDKPVRTYRSEPLPQTKISADTKQFKYTHGTGDRSAIRLTRIVSETVRLNLTNVRWFVMGDDDTVFIPDNLVRVLSKYDHNQPYYIGSPSESHIQNIIFSYNMAYGGGGFAISRALAVSLSKIQDRCLNRYPALYGSDDRIHACMAELGIPLTKHPGFHQCDVYGDLLGLLASHPIAPLISLHHLDVVHPIFPGMTRANAIKKLFDGPIKLDSAGMIQQSICYEPEKRWTISVSWGFVVQIVRGVMSPREMEMPTRTFLNWFKRADYFGYSFNTRPVARSPCQKPFVYYLSDSRYDARLRTTITEYVRHKEKHPYCKWKWADPSEYVNRVVVYKKPDPAIWDRAPRRNCCKILKMSSNTMSISVGPCKDDEIIEA